MTRRVTGFRSACSRGGRDDSFGFLRASSNASCTTEAGGYRSGRAYGLFEPEGCQNDEPNVWRFQNEGGRRLWFSFLSPAAICGGKRGSLSRAGRRGRRRFRILRPGFACGAALNRHLLRLRGYRVRIRPPAQPMPRGRQRALRCSVGTGGQRLVDRKRQVDQLIQPGGRTGHHPAILQQCAIQLQDSGAGAPGLRDWLPLERNTWICRNRSPIRMLPISFVFSRFPRGAGPSPENWANGSSCGLPRPRNSTRTHRAHTRSLTHLIATAWTTGSSRRRNALPQAEPGEQSPSRPIAKGQYRSSVGTTGRPPIARAILPRPVSAAPGFEQMSGGDVFNLVLSRRDFSTADRVTGVSGRGVEWTSSAATSRPWVVGSISSDGRDRDPMTVRLPLTLAILDGMSVAVGDHLHPTLASGRRVPAAEGGGHQDPSNLARVIQVRGEYLPVVVLRVF